jgi:Integrase core domain
VALERAEITISREGPGHVLDNLFVEHLGRTVKYGYIYLKDYANVPTLEAGLEPDFSFYSHERPHQSLAYWMPTAVHLEHDRYGAKHPLYFYYFPVLTMAPIIKSLASTPLKIDKNTCSMFVEDHRHSKRTPQPQERPSDGIAPLRDPVVCSSVMRRLQRYP